MYEFLDRRYALALYKICKENNKVERVLEQFKEIVYEMKSNEGLMKLIKHPQISKTDKKKIFTEIFQDKIEDELLGFLMLLIDKERILFLREKYEQFKLIDLEEKNTVIAVVRAVVPLSENQKDILKAKLEKMYNKTIIIKEEIDPTLIGGLMIMVGTDVIDGSIKEKLSELKELSVASQI